MTPDDTEAKPKPAGPTPVEYIPREENWVSLLMREQRVFREGQRERRRVVRRRRSDR
jgi:hypothetical protein